MKLGPKHLLVLKCQRLALLQVLEHLKLLLLLREEDVRQYGRLKRRDKVPIDADLLYRPPHLLVVAVVVFHSKLFYFVLEGWLA